MSLQGTHWAPRKASGHSVEPFTMATVAGACSEPDVDPNERGNADPAVVPTTQQSQPTPAAAREPKLKRFRFSETYDIFLLRAVRSAT